MAEPRFETRITWAASSDIGFHGHTDWTPSEASDAFRASEEAHTYGLEEALEASGFEWDVEVREVADE